MSEFDCKTWRSYRRLSPSLAAIIAGHRLKRKRLCAQLSNQTDLEVVVNGVHDNLSKMKVNVQYMGKSFIL